nr:MAG TPA: hypothetical protein [Caudoviricetes sp.]
MLLILVERVFLRLRGLLLRFFRLRLRCGMRRAVRLNC